MTSYLRTITSMWCCMLINTFDFWNHCFKALLTVFIQISIELEVMAKVRQFYEVFVIGLTVSTSQTSPHINAFIFQFLILNNVLFGEGIAPVDKLKKLLVFARTAFHSSWYVTLWYCSATDIMSSLFRKIREIGILIIFFRIDRLYLC